MGIRGLLYIPSSQFSCILSYFCNEIFLVEEEEEVQREEGREENECVLPGTRLELSTQSPSPGSASVTDHSEALASDSCA